MRTVTLRLSGEDFSAAIVRMRDWFNKHPCEPTGYRYDQSEDTVVVSVDFAIDAHAKAFVKHFGDQSATGDL
jgi:hypothetical protein